MVGRMVAEQQAATRFIHNKTRLGVSTPTLAQHSSMHDVNCAFLPRHLSTNQTHCTAKPSAWSRHQSE